MTRIVAYGSPKGGVAKSTETLNQPAVFARYLPGIRQLVVDADDNRSVSECLKRTPERLLPGVDVDAVDDPRTLTKLRRLAEQNTYDVIWIDLPGAKRTGELRALLDGDGQGAIPDLVIVPMTASTFDLRVAVRAVREEIIPAGVEYGVLLTRVDSSALESAIGWRAQLEGLGLVTFSTLVREYRDYQHAEADSLPLTAFGGKRAYARKGEDDQRSLAREIAARLHLEVTIPTREQEREAQRG